MLLYFFARIFFPKFVAKVMLFFDIRNTSAVKHKIFPLYLNHTCSYFAIGMKAEIIANNLERR